MKDVKQKKFIFSFLFAGLILLSYIATFNLMLSYIDE